MSSSNLVRLAFVPETVYGQTPTGQNYTQARFTSDSLSGSPETTESQQIRTDRLSSGQVATGLTVGGDINFELAKEAAIDELIESAMYNSWTVSAPVNADLTIDTTAGTIDRAAGDYTSEVAVGDIITLAGFSNSVNNTQIMVVAVVDADTIRYVGPDTMVDEVGAGTSFEVSDKISIGTTKKSFTMEKAFLDLTEKAINYRGMIASNMNLNVAYGEIITGNFSFQGNDYQPVQAAADFATNGETINPAATTNSMNGSIDMPFLVLEDTTLDETTFCIQSVEISMNNNLTAQTCIGRAAPQDYSEGTAQIEVSMTAYLANENWQLLSKKLSQQSFAVGFLVKNVDGYYGFYMPAIQVSFDDPASAGINQDVLITMSGTAKVGPNGESSLVMYRG
jgi:hypothetical protein